MKKIFGSLVVQFREFYSGLSPTKRISMVSASAIFVIALLIISFMLSGRDYVPLLTNIPNEQIGLITQQLREKNIPFRMENNGATITVPVELLHSTQMALMSEIGGAELGNVGLEIFEKQSFGTSTYAQRVNYQRALQGELMRSINSLSAVKQSKVILALPAKKTFLEEGGKASASVVLELNAGKTLSADQIRGMQYLVSSAVENLDPGDVTVVDDRGKVLTRDSNGSTSASSEILDLKRKIEAQYEDRIEAILSKVVGAGKVIARVDATLNHRQRETLQEVVDPEQTAVLSQTSETEALNGDRTSPAGVPGARANLPGAEDAGQIGMRQNVNREIATTNYEVPKTVHNIREAAGNIERLSVAVLVDGKVVFQPGAEGGEAEAQWSPREAAEMAKYETLVKNAIGFSEKRGDSVNIENIAFTKEDFSEAEKILTTLERKKLLQALFKWSLLGFSLALFFFIVVRPFMQWITDSFQDTMEDMLPRTIEELEELQSVDNTLPGMMDALPILEDSLDPDKAESELLKDRIINLMAQDEEKASNAFGLWLVRKDL